MTKTPRTDALAPTEVYDSHGNAYMADLVPASFARKLEEENVRLRGLLQIAADGLVAAEARRKDLTT